MFIGRIAEASLLLDEAVELCICQILLMSATRQRVYLMVQCQLLPSITLFNLLNKIFVVLFRSSAPSKIDANFLKRRLKIFPRD